MVIEIGTNKSNITIANLTSSVRGINFSLKVATINNIVDTEAIVGKTLDLNVNKK